MKKSVIIYADDDLERLNDLRRNVAIAEAAVEAAKKEATRHGDTTEDEDAAVQAAKDAYDEALDAAAERADEWVVGTIGHGEFRDLLAKHPARMVDVEEPVEGGPKRVMHPDDAELGFGVDTSAFGRALLMFVDEDDPEIRTILEPTDNVARKVKRLSVGQFDTLWITAYTLNTGGVMDPKATRFSIVPTSSAT